MLGYELAYQVVSGIQSQGVIANAKHFFNNNQENNRHSVSENVDERTQMEIYMEPFRGAVDAGLLSVMCANNRVNTVDFHGPGVSGSWYSCENNHTVNTMLKGWLGFKGWQLSDYK